MSPLLDPLFGAEAAALFDDRARLQAMLRFEKWLAAAEAVTGVIPKAAAPAIGAKCRADLYDIEQLAQATAHAGNPVIPMVQALTALVAADDAEAARYVHWGATSQDVMDNALLHQIRQLYNGLALDLDELAAALVRLVEAHRTTPIAGRTFLQQAPPVTFGFKVAGWLDAILRHRERLNALAPRLFVLQFGGAVGTLAALGEDGLRVAESLAAATQLRLPPMPWHTHRDGLAEFAAALGLLTGTLGKIGRDLSLMMQTEVAEAFEPGGEGRGGSSTMPHKRNPITAAVQIAAATRAPGLVATLLSAMVQEHERGVGGWHAEWTTLPELCVLAAGSLRQTMRTMAGLEVDPARMRANLEATRGQIFAEAVMMALGARIGRLAAHDLVHKASQRAASERRHLRDVLAADPVVGRHLAGTELDRLFEPANYLGQADAFIARVLDRAREVRNG